MVSTYLTSKFFKPDIVLTYWFLRNNGDDTKYDYKYLLIVPFLVQTITTRSKPFHRKDHKGTLLANALTSTAIFTVDGLITVGKHALSAPQESVMSIYSDKLAHVQVIIWTS